MEKSCGSHALILQPSLKSLHYCYCSRRAWVSLTLLELSQVGLQDRGVEGQAARVQLAHKHALCLKLLQQRLDVILRTCSNPE